MTGITMERAKSEIEKWEKAEKMWSNRLIAEYEDHGQDFVEDRVSRPHPDPHLRAAHWAMEEGTKNAVRYLGQFQATSARVSTWKDVLDELCDHQEHDWYGKETPHGEKVYCENCDLLIDSVVREPEAV